MKPFSEALGERMKALGLEQLELSVLSGVSQSSISNYLTERRHPQPDSIEKLAGPLGVEPEYFLEYRISQTVELMKIDEDAAADVYRVTMRFLGDARRHREEGGQ